MQVATYNDAASDRAYFSDPTQPSLEGKPPRIKARGSQLVDGVRFFSPYMPAGDNKVQILGVGVAPTQEEAASVVEGIHDVEVMQKPRLFKGPLGTIISDALDRNPLLHSANFAYTVLTPWLLPRNRRYRPSKEEIRWASPLLHETVKQCQPQIILAFGKLAFEQLVDMKISHDDARGGWFSYKDTGIPVYLMDASPNYLMKPWTIDTLLTDTKEVDRMMRFRQGVPSSEIPLDNTVVDTMEQLHAMVDEIIEGKYFEISDDCEWSGSLFPDDRLRSYQLCLKPGRSFYLRFFDENDNLYLGRVHPEEGAAFTDYEAVGRVLGRAFELIEPYESQLRDFYADSPHKMDTDENRRRRTYMGHFATSDTPWKERWMKLKAIGKVSFDSAYALQTCDEYAPLGLDALAMRLTQFGRYDMDLVLWKMKNRKLMAEDGGYGKIPDEILIPYACIDVEVVARAKPALERMMDSQGLIPYYRAFVLPFVTDTFHTFIMTGLPVDRKLFELTRGFMNWAYRALLKDFRKRLEAHASAAVADASGIDLAVVKALARMRDAGKVTESVTALQNAWNGEPDNEVLTHWSTVRSFNIRSHPQLQQWLFGVLKLTPVKSTKNGKTGAPSTLWARVMEFPEKIQKEFTPAVDKETIEILQEADDTGLVSALMAVSNVGNQCKGFLKEGTFTDDGELVEEKGLAQFIASTGRLHAHLGLTETARPKSYEPNILNLTKFHNRGVVRGLSRLLENPDNDPDLVIPEEFWCLFGSPEDRVGIPASELIKKRMPSVRSTVAAPPGWCFVESDYQTAEVRDLAFRSGDEALLRLILGRDTSFGLCKEKPVRLHYAPNSPIYPDNQDPAFLMAVCVEGKDPVPVTEQELDRDEEGNLLHPKFDMHWAVAEECQHKPREAMSADRDRGAGKVTRFCIAEDELVRTRNRGSLPIQKVRKTDVVWDGEAWVSHGGVVYSGEKEVMWYQGLWASKNHGVWTAEGFKVTLSEARIRGLDLMRAGPDKHLKHVKAVNPENRVTATYDILDAGPRNRFTCSGVVVSNSGSYGAVGATIDRRIEAITGIRPEPGTGQKMLDALAISQPVATAFLEEVSKAPERGRTLVAKSGRIRRFPIHSSELRGLSHRVRSSYLRAMGNEARNFYPQEGVAAALARSCQRLNAFFRAQNMLARTAIGLYDAINTLCPLEERFIVSEAHAVFMDRTNIWRHHDRWMSYTIDTELVYRWSWKPDEKDKKDLQDKSWRVMLPERSAIIERALKQAEDMFWLCHPGVKERVNTL